MATKTDRKWQSASVGFDLKKGSFDLSLPGFGLKGCQVLVKAAVTDAAKLAPCRLSWKLEESDDACLRLSAKNAQGKWLLTFSPADGEGIAIDLRGEVTGDFRALQLVSLYMEKMKADHVLVHGRRMGGCDTIMLPSKEEKSWSSSFQQMITRDGVTLQISHPLAQTHPATITGTAKGKAVLNLIASSLADFVPAGAEVVAATTTLRASKDGHSLMTAWGDREKTPGTKLAQQKHGWNTWDYYRWTVTEDEVLANAELIKNDPVLSKHIKRIIVDDGWQYCYGEWEANPLFPSGMKALAQKLTAMGFEPGLWFAPCVIEPHCRIAQLDDDMLALGEGGQPCLSYSCMKRFGFVLDPTSEKVRNWLRELFSRYADYGYKYFKLDFLWQVLKAPRFHDESVPRGKMMELLVGPIREATKGKAEILGCNYNFEGGSALVDAVRVSGDIHARWKSVMGNVFPIAARFWSHNRLWINDPDFAVCRGRDTANDPDLHRLKPCLVYVEENSDPEFCKVCADSLVDLSLGEARTLLGLVVISGGAINLSDKLTRLNETGLEMLRRTVAAPIGEAGVPLDLFSSRRPCYWLQPVGKKWRALLINWEDKAAELSLDLSKHGITADAGKNFWTDEQVKIKNNVLRAKLPPHESLLVEV
jgi:hypothetical protein